MIQGLTHGNTGLKIKEDTLTAFVMAQMLHLPDDMIWGIFRNSCSDNTDLPEDVGELEQFEFWPRWDPDSTGNKNSVEPDMFIRFKRLDVIIEAKRHDQNEQYVEQWQKEARAYMNEYGEEERKMILLAVGGIWKKETAEIDIPKTEKTFLVFKCKWQHILNEILRLHIQSESIVDILKKSLNVAAYKRTFQSLIKAFEMHGFFVGQWLETMPRRYDIGTEDKIKKWLPVP